MAIKKAIPGPVKKAAIKRREPVAVASPAATPSPVEQYEIRLIGVRVTAIKFTVVRQPSEEYSRDFAYNVGKAASRRGEEQFEVVFTVGIAFKNAEARPFDAEFTVVGTYAHKAGLPDSVVSYFQNINGPLMLWSYIRELVSSTTARAGFPPLLIETLDVARFREKAARKLQDKTENG